MSFFWLFLKKLRVKCEKTLVSALFLTHLTWNNVFGDLANYKTEFVGVQSNCQQCGQKWCFITKVVFWDTSVVWKFWQWCFHWKGWLFNFDLLISLKWGTFQTFSIFFVKKCIKCHLMWAFFEKNHPISNYQIIFKGW